MKWFKHQAAANRDDKLEKLLMKYGSDGYALYWLCLEIITASLDENNYTFELKHDAEVLGYRLRIDSIIVEEIMAYMVALELFENHDGVITCFKLAKRLAQSMTSNPELRKILTNFRENHDAVMTKSQEAVTRVDKTRLDKNRNNTKRVSFKKPTIEQLQKHIDEKGLSVDAEKFYYFYESKKWMIGKNKMASWKAALQTWHKKHWEEPYAKIDKRTTAKRSFDKLKEIAEQEIQENGIIETMD